MLNCGFKALTPEQSSGHDSMVATDCEQLSIFLHEDLFTTSPNGTTCPTSINYTSQHGSLNRLDSLFFFN